MHTCKIRMFFFTKCSIDLEFKNKSKALSFNIFCILLLKEKFQVFNIDSEPSFNGKEGSKNQN